MLEVPSCVNSRCNFNSTNETWIDAAAESEATAGAETEGHATIEGILGAAGAATAASAAAEARAAVVTILAAAGAAASAMPVAAATWRSLSKALGNTA